MVPLGSTRLFRSVDGCGVLQVIMFGARTSTLHMHHDRVKFDVAPSSLEASEVRVITEFLGASQTRSRHSNCQRALQAPEYLIDKVAHTDDTPFQRRLSPVAQPRLHRWP